jgi:hypothetical protein
MANARPPALYVGFVHVGEQPIHLRECFVCENAWDPHGCTKATAPASG